MSANAEGVESAAWLNTSAVRIEAGSANGMGDTKSSGVGVDDFHVLGIGMSQVALFLVKFEQRCGWVKSDDLSDSPTLNVLPN